MKRYLFAVICMVYFVASDAQAQSVWTDDFSNFRHPDRWFGDTSLFSNNGASGMLSLADSVSRDAQLFRLSSAWDSARWQFRVEMDFTPSSSNYAAFAVGMHRTDFFGDNQGYFVRIGGGTQRRISLMRRNGTSNATVVESSANFLQVPNVGVDIELERSPQGVWTLKCDTGSGMMILGSALDNTIAPGPYVGFICRYTATRADKIRFSNLSVEGGSFYSNSPFLVSRVEVMDNHRAILELSHPPVFSSLQQLNLTPRVNFNGLYHRDDPYRIELIFTSDTFEYNRQYVCRISGLQSSESLENLDSSIVFFRFKPKVGDVIINELMIDPSPAVAHLPEVEYVELFNATQWDFDLGNWQIQTGSTHRFLPEVTIPSKGYLLLVRANDAWWFSDSLLVAPMDWGVNALPNSSGLVLLFSPDAEIMDRVDYQLDWYNDAAKSGGGWSLERRIKDRMCNDPSNWGASNSAIGGTPGRANSLTELIEPLRVSHTAFLGGRWGEVHFNLPIEDDSELEVTVRGVKTERFLRHERCLRIDLAPFIDQVEMPVRIEGVLSDCMGQKWGDTTLIFVKPERPKPGELLINEILPAPPTNGASYVELINASNAWLDLQGIALARYDAGIFDIRRLLDSSFLFAPGQIIAFSHHPDRIVRDFTNSNSGAIRRASLPSMPNASGGLALLGQEGILLDSMLYDESMHSPFLQDVRGISLERVHPNNPSMERETWVSATSQAHWGTPGLPNSQFRNVGHTEEAFSLGKDVINLNRSELLEVFYDFADMGGVGHLRIHTANGFEVYVFPQRDLLGSSGVLVWDGRTSRGEYAPSGLYIVSLEVLFPNGKRKVYKDAFAIVH